jgi:hypothetical protein
LRNSVDNFLLRGVEQQHGFHSNFRKKERREPFWSFGIMKKFAIFTIFCFVVASFAQSDVIDLTAASFDAELAQHNIALVEFYAPW